MLDDRRLRGASSTGSACAWAGCTAHTRAQLPAQIATVIKEFIKLSRKRHAVFKHSSLI
jgi:hypothetical protein